MELFDDKPFKVRKHEEIAFGRFAIVKEEISYNQKTYPFSYEKLDDCVCILPICGDNVVLIRQYRHNLGEWILEFPGGGIDKDDPESAAKRELKEETGYEALSLCLLGLFPVSPGTSTSKVYLYVADCVKTKEQNLDDTELIKVKEVSIKDFESMIENGKFNFLAGITMWHIYRIRRKNGI